jgi:hypothetical protein
MEEYNKVDGIQQFPSDNASYVHQLILLIL